MTAQSHRGRCALFACAAVRAITRLPVRPAGLAPWRRREVSDGHAHHADWTEQACATFARRRSGSTLEAFPEFVYRETVASLG